MNLPPKLVAEILARPDTVVRQGGEVISVGGEPVDSELPAKMEFVLPAISLTDGVLTVVLPIATKNESNERGWKSKARRAKGARTQVSDVLGRHYELLHPFIRAYHCDDKPLRLTFTRLGGRRLDPNGVAATMKAVEDAVEAALLANDGNPKWVPTYEQEPGGLVGVRIEISIFT